MLNRITHIAFADDDPGDHELLSFVISEISPGIAITSFYRCDYLLEYLNDENRLLPDIILLDYNMPGNNGNECLTTIKKMARLMNIPVVIYSTSGQKELIDEAYKQGADKYLVKPSDYKGTKAAIRQLIQEIG